MLNPDFQDMLSALSAEGADFLVVGAYALASHGNPRATGDIDLWVRPTPENAQRVYKALQIFGAPLEKLTVDDLHTLDTVFQIGVVPSRIDILTSIDGIAFDEAWRDRKAVTVGKTNVFVISKPHLIRNKKAAGRPKDLLDATWLENTDLE